VDLRKAIEARISLVWLFGQSLVQSTPPCHSKFGIDVDNMENEFLDRGGGQACK